MGQPKRAKAWTPEIQTWEVDLCKGVAHRLERDDPEELWSALDECLCRLKRFPPHDVHNWPAYLYTALRNEAKDWLTRRQKESESSASLDAPLQADTDMSATLEDIIQGGDMDPAEQVALTQFWEALGPALQSTWLALKETGGNESKAARLLGIHRNTVRARRRAIEAIEVAHGFPPSFPVRATSSAHRIRSRPLPLVSRRPRSIDLSALVARKVLWRRLNGSQWRVLLWLTVNSQKRRTPFPPFSPSTIARELHIDRSSARRAVNRLVAAQMLVVHEGAFILSENLRSRR